MAPQPGQEFKVRIAGLTYKTGSETKTYTPFEVDANIEPLVTQIWLDEAYCLDFEKHFGVAWESQRNMYFINDPQHDMNLSKNLSLTFSVGHHNTNITLHYTDLALTASYPLVPTTRRYFPLRRILYKGEPQAVLGRVFLQAAYILADYDRKTFNISQAKTGKPRVRAILQPALGDVNDTVIPIGSIPGNRTAEAQSHKAATPVRVTAAVSLTSVLVMLGISGLLVLRRFRRRANDELSNSGSSEGQNKVRHPLHFDGKAELDGKPKLPPEVHAIDIKELDALQVLTELESKKFGYELPADVPAELYGDMPWQEKDAYVHELEAREKPMSRWQKLAGRKSKKDVVIWFDQTSSTTPEKSPVDSQSRDRRQEADTNKEDTDKAENIDHIKQATGVRMLAAFEHSGSSQGQETVLSRKDQLEADNGGWRTPYILKYTRRCLMFEKEVFKILGYLDQY